MYYLIIAAKALAFVVFREYDISKLEWVSFLSTPYQKESNVDEASFFLRKNLDPYVVDEMYQKPLVLIPLALMKQNRYFYDLFFLISDILIGHLITKLARQDQKGYRFTLQLFYHLNPITFYNLLARNTDCVEILCTLLSVWIINSLNGSYIGVIISSLFYAFSVYSNPNHIIFIGSIFLILRKNRKGSLNLLLAIFYYIILSVLYTTFFIFSSYKITGTWLFWEKCYIDAYFPTDHFPTLGFIWALFSGIFTKYKTMYHALFFIFPICFVVPYYVIFSKYGITKKENPLGFIGLSLGCYYFTTLLYYHYVTIYNIFLASALLYQGYEYIVKIKIAYILIYASSFIALMAYGLSYTWLHSLTGNPNFLFFQCFIFYLFMVALVTETIREVVKRGHEEKIKKA